MSDGGLTPDIPLGPFEGTSITAYTASKSAKLHASRHCSRLRAGQISEVGLPLNAATIELGDSHAPAQSAINCG